ncbi:MAG: imidazole glycerol phosphate synthase subunit HisH [Acidiferrobacterales bacterium]
MKDIAIIDYGMGNLRSVQKALEHVAPSARVAVTTDPDRIHRADSVVFPGQGAISGCLAALEEHGLGDVLLDAARTKPFLGICLGLQALFEYSEEGGGTPGLGLLPGRVKLFPAEQMQDAGRSLKVPHMGWNQVQRTHTHPLWRDIAANARFYFVHSYYVECKEQRYIAGVTQYGVRFTSAAARENLFALQCHPEKSQHAGLQLLRNFVSWDGTY